MNNHKATASFKSPDEAIDAMGRLKRTSGLFSFNMVVSGTPSGCFQVSALVGSAGEQAKAESVLKGA